MASRRGISGRLIGRSRSRGRSLRGRSLALLAGLVVVAWPAAVAAASSTSALSASVHASFKSTARYTEVLALTARDVPVGATVRVTCGGPGCPYARERVVAQQAGTISFEPRFHGRRLRIGDRISVTISDLHGASKTYEYTIRAHKTPVAHEA